MSRPRGGVYKKVQVWIHTEEPAARRRFLLLKMRPERGGFWQPVTGKVESGEDIARAAERESDEETSLPFKEKPVAIGHEFAFRKGENVYHESVFRRRAEASMERSVVMDLNEHLAFEWVSREEAHKRVAFDSNRDALKAVLSNLGEN